MYLLVFFMNVFYNTKSNVFATIDQIYLYTYLLLFVNKNVSLGFIKLLCTRDFSRVFFAAELSTKLVYNSVFVKYYLFLTCYIFFILYKI